MASAMICWTRLPGGDRMLATDTIAAVSSGPGAAARGIVRVSGPGAWGLALDLVEGVAGEAAGVHLGRLRRHAAGVGVMVVLFKGPRSFTGADVAELHVPGSPALLGAIMEDLLGRGARQAGPGEFTAQAFFNGKLDLTEAEGIAATIAARNAVELRAAAALREGVLHREIAALTERMADLLAAVEAGIDFTDEADVSFVSQEEAAAALAGLTETVERLLHTAVRVDRLDALPAVVLTGLPNVGKSSLMNALSGTQRAIVSPVAGTTRDMLTAVVETEAGAVRLVDVPGEEAAVDDLRAGMMEARRLALLEADLVLVVSEVPPGEKGVEVRVESPAPVVRVHNKCDVWGGAREGLCVSARTGAGLERLRGVLSEAARQHRGESGGVGAEMVALNQRHRVLLQGVRGALGQARQMAAEAATFRRHPELLAAELRQGLDLVGEITGVVSPEEVLGRVFGRFCIGK